MADVVVDEAPLVLGVVISTLALGGIFIFARTITRIIIKPQFGWDDALIIVTWVCCLIAHPVKLMSTNLAGLLVHYTGLQYGYVRLAQSWLWQTCL